MSPDMTYSSHGQVPSRRLFHEAATVTDKGQSLSLVEDRET